VIKTERTDSRTIRFTGSLVMIKTTNIKKHQSNLGRASSPPLTAEHNYATKSTSVTMECPTFAPKTAPSLRRFPSPSNTPIVDRPYSYPDRHPDPISRFATVHPPDRQTDRQMGYRRQVCTKTRLRCVYILSIGATRLIMRTSRQKRQRKGRATPRWCTRTCNCHSISE